MITLEEFKQLANDTGLHLWKNEALFYNTETTWYISYPMPFFKEGLEDLSDFDIHCAIMSYAPNKERTELYVYDEIEYSFDRLDKIVNNKEIWTYNMVSSQEYDDGYKWKDKTYDELKNKLLQIKKEIFDKQQEVNLERIKGDF